MARKLTLVFGRIYGADGGRHSGASSRLDAEMAAGSEGEAIPGMAGNSPDLNPIENIWSQVKHAQGLEHATSIPGLKKLHVTSGDKSHQNTYRASMNRCRGKWLRSFRQGKATPDIEYLDWLFEPVFDQ